MLLGEDIKNCKMLVLNMIRFLEFQKDKFRLFHLITAEGENKSLKKYYEKCRVYETNFFVEETQKDKAFLLRYLLLHQL